jgi:CDP-paratose 2-epimerase
MAGYNNESPEYLINTNLLGTVNCLEWARKHNTSIIFLSTSRVYPIAAINNAKFHEEDTRYSWVDEQELLGISNRGITEAFPIGGFRSLYGMTKLASEMLLEEYRYAYGIESIINRCGVIAGPWQMGKADQGVITFWIIQHLFNRPLKYIGYGGAGKQVRDFLHIDDLADLIIEQINNFDNFKGETFNVGGGADYSLSLSELTALCQEICGQKVQIGAEPHTRTADIRIYLSDCSKLYSKCSWRPKRTASQTVEDIARWFRDNSEKMKEIFGNE